MLPIAILCMGGHGRTLAAIARRHGAEVFEYDDNPDPKRGSNGTLAVAETLMPDNWHLINGAGLIGGDLSTRIAIGRRFRHLGFKFAPVIASSSTRYIDIAPDSGIQILAGAVIGTDVKLGQDVIVGANAVVEHDCVIGRASFIGPGAVLCGNVRLGDGVIIGAGAVLLPGVWVGDGSRIRAGSVTGPNTGVASTA